MKKLGEAEKAVSVTYFAKLYYEASNRNCDKSDILEGLYIIELNSSLEFGTG